MGQLASLPVVSWCVVLALLMLRARFWFTRCMIGASKWDSGAAERLAQVAADLRDVGVVDVLAREVRVTWSANLQRYEPRELGDTPQLLGLLCAGNIGQRVVRCYPELAASPGASPLAVRASLPDGSLLVSARGIELQARKAPGSTLEPDWSAFSWEESAGVRRHAAAGANSRSYRPARSDQRGRAPLLDDGGLWPLDDPAALRQVTLVWAGALDGERTAGWLGFPCLGNPAWFAVVELWTDVGGVLPADTRPAPQGSPDRSDTFENRPTPPLGLGLRARPGQEEQT